MAGFFSVRLAPGVRISASPRGLRTHLGPRGARVHIGGGRTGVSTGTGPFTFYESVGGSSSRGSGPTRPYDTGSSAAQIALVGKAQQAQHIAESLQKIENIHRQAFAPAVKPTAPPAAPPDVAALLRAAEKRELQGIGFFKFSARAEAKQRARTGADEQARSMVAQGQAEQGAHQDLLDRQWADLLANNEDIVLGVLAHAFEDNEAPVSPVGVDGAAVSLVVLVPPVEAVPGRYPATTQAGNLSIRTMTKKMRAGYYRQLVAGHAVVSANEAFAVAPGLHQASIVVLRDGGLDVYGGHRAQPILCTRLSRARLEGIEWMSVNAWDVIDQTGADTIVKARGAAVELQPLDLSNEPDLRHVASAVDLEELTSARGQ